MQLRLIQIVSKVAFASLMLTALNAKEIPVMKETIIEIPAKDYSVVTFPFKIANIQMGAFSYRKEKNKPLVPAIKDNGVKKISLSKKDINNNSKQKSVGNNILNIKKIDNMLTFRPKTKGQVEIIVWGNKDFPMIIKIKVVDFADKNIKFVQVVDSRKEVVNFESSPHEKVIERIMRFLHNSSVNPKPRGYENIVRKEIYDVGIKNREGVTFARVRVSLTKEVVGKIYVGQEWNVNIVPEFDNENGETIDIPDRFSLTLYEEMFDSPGVFAVSLETYSITKEHGTRVMIVRNKEQNRWK